MRDYQVLLFLEWSNGLRRQKNKDGEWLYLIGEHENRNHKWKTDKEILEYWRENIWTKL